MIYLGEGTKWEEIQKVMNGSTFMTRLMTLDKDNISAATIKKISAYTSKADFVPSNLAKVSKAAASLCGYVRSIDEYS